MAGKLTITEKYIIQGMLHSKKSLEEIAVALKRPEKTVQNYIDKELDELYNTIVKVQMATDKVFEELQEDIPEPAKKVQTKKPNLFIHESASKTTKVAISTPATSQIGDEHHKNAKKTQSRTSRGNVWNISEEEIRE